MAWDEELKKASLRKNMERQPQYLKHADLIYYPSSINPNISLGAIVFKPPVKGHILVNIHGWHGSISQKQLESKAPKSDKFLIVDVDMRGRAFSDGEPDCNGLELIDVIDAVEFVKREYEDHIYDESSVYLWAGSGGGGNVMTLINKFPDYFTAACAECGISDYALWYRGDILGEFRDEMDVWIGKSPEDDPDAYMARSGYYLCQNQLTPLILVHGELDERVPAEHSRRYMGRAVELGKPCEYMELEGVGGRAHYSNASPHMLNDIKRRVEDFLLSHREPRSLSDKGQMAVGGYLKTEKFAIWLESIDHYALIEYDLSLRRVELLSEYPGDIKLEWF